jgi:hypothetical protein
MIEMEEFVGERINPRWFASLKKTILSNNVVLLLCERLEQKEKKLHNSDPTHYLVVVGFEQSVKKRGKTKLFCKDGMEKDTLLTAELERIQRNNDTAFSLVLTVYLPGGGKDTYKLMECVHYDLN